MHKWERIRSNSYGSEYRCMKCSEHFEAYDDGESISLPPIARCPEDGKAGCTHTINIPKGG